MVRPVRDLGLRERWQEACQGDACLPRAAVGALGARGRLRRVPEAGSASGHARLPGLCSRSALTQGRLCSPGRLWGKPPSCEQEPRKASCEASARAPSAPSLGAHPSSGPRPGPRRGACWARPTLASAHPGLARWTSRRDPRPAAAGEARLAGRRPRPALVLPPAPLCLPGVGAAGGTLWGAPCPAAPPVPLPPHQPPLAPGLLSPCGITNCPCSQQWCWAPAVRQFSPIQKASRMASLEQQHFQVHA